MNKTPIFENFKCGICKTSPIKSICYRCITCQNYNLCASCEEIHGPKHGHNFLKLRSPKDFQLLSQKYQPKISDTTGRLRSKKLRAGKNYNPFSFQVIDKKALYNTLNNNDSLTIPITLKNDGEKDWPCPCFFTCLEEESNIVGDRVKMVKCEGKIGETYQFKIKLDLSRAKETELFTSVWCLKDETGENFGPKVMFKVYDMFQNGLQIKKKI